MRPELRIMELESEVSRLRAMVKVQADILRPSDPDRETWLGIVDAVCHELGVSNLRVLSAERTQEIAEARQLSHFVAKVGLGWSCHRVGAACLRDHGTIQHSIRQITNRCDTSLRFAAITQRLVSQFTK